MHLNVNAPVTVSAVGNVVTWLPGMLSIAESAASWSKEIPRNMTATETRRHKESSCIQENGKRLGL